MRQKSRKDEVSLTSNGMLVYVGNPKDSQTSTSLLGLISEFNKIIRYKTNTHKNQLDLYILNCCVETK